MTTARKKLHKIMRFDLASKVCKQNLEQKNRIHFQSHLSKLCPTLKPQTGLIRNHKYTRLCAEKKWEDLWISFYAKLLTEKWAEITKQVGKYWFCRPNRMMAGFYLFYVWLRQIISQFGVIFVRECRKFCYIVCFCRSIF